MEPMEACSSEPNRFRMDWHPTGAVLPVESQRSLSQMGEQQKAVLSHVGLAGPVGELGVCSEATSGWTRRVRIGKAFEFY